MRASGTNFYSVPVKPDQTVEVRLYAAFLEVREGANISPGTSAAMNVDNRSWIWSTTSSKSRARWPDLNRWPHGGKEDCGRKATTGWEELTLRHGKTERHLVR